MPTCKICGKKHWPLDPSCMGKKGTRAEAWARAKAEAQEKARARTEARAKAKTEAEEKVRIKAEAKARTKAEKEAKIEAKAKAKGETAQKVCDTSEIAAKGEHSSAPAVMENPARNFTAVLLVVRAKDIMRKDAVWSSSDDTVRDVLKKMQQHDASYLMIGRNEVLQGIVSKSDLAGTVNPYLWPVFVKWQRPSDDATLQIKIKWIMARPARPISPDTPFAAMMAHIRQSGGQCLPVMDKQGKIQGVVTAFDIFKIKALLKLESNPSISTTAKAPQARPIGAICHHRPEMAAQSSHGVIKQNSLVP